MKQERLSTATNDCEQTNERRAKQTTDKRTIHVQHNGIGTSREIRLNFGQYVVDEIVVVNFRVDCGRRVSSLGRGNEGDSTRVVVCSGTFGRFPFGQNDQRTVKFQHETKHHKKG